MRRFIIEQSDADFTSHSGLALVGMALNRHSGLATAVDEQVALRHGIAHSDVLRSYIGLLCLGKSDFEAIENVRNDDFFVEALGVSTVSSAATLRQRLDERATAFLPLVEEASVDFLLSVDVTPTVLDTGHVPLDADVTPFDNSNTRKEGVSRTYKGHDGYAPMAAYLGREGYCLEFELREGKQHCQRDTPEFLTRVLERARRVTDEPVLLRLDCGNDALENIDVVLEHNESDAVGVDFLIKWNPRKEDPYEWLDYAEKHARFSHPRPGKRVAVFNYQVTRYRNGYEYQLRRVMRVIERTIDKEGSGAAGARDRDRGHSGRASPLRQRRSSRSMPTTGRRSSFIASSRPNSTSSACPRASSPPMRWCSPAPLWPTTSCAGSARRG